LQALHRDRALAGPPWSGQDDEPHRDWTAGQPEPPCPERAIWLGDFNMEPGSAEHAAVTGQTPYHPGARYAGGLVDAVAQVGARLHTHVKTIAGVERRRQLDHCFVTADLAPLVRLAHADAGCTASDHLPLWIDLDLPA